jgi:hypothetical protein
MQWHSDTDYPVRVLLRREVAIQTARLLQKKNPDAEDWTKKLPDLVRRLEYGLYHTADSMDKYVNKQTLTQRLRHLLSSFFY